MRKQWRRDTNLVVIEFDNLWQDSSLKGLFPELQGTRRRINLFPVPARLLVEQVDDAGAEAVEVLLALGQ